MARATICKEFTFEAAHKLPNHDGKCRNLHGHTYRVQIWIEGIIRMANPSHPHPKEGMVVDFGEVSEYFQDYVFSVLDHSYLNDALPFVTTAENLSWWIMEQMANCLEGGNTGIKVTKVRVWETKKSFAEVTRG